MTRLMFRITLLVFITTFIQVPMAIAQQPTGAISGTVIDADARQPLAGAHIRIPELDQGEVSDDSGIFRFTDVPVGVYSIRISYMGFQTRTLTDIVVRSNRTQNVEAELQMATVEGEAITVSSGYFQRSKTVGRASMNSEEIRRSPGSGQSLNRVMTSVPGVATTENSQDLMVRGGSPQENAYYINNIFVPTINHFQGQEARSYGPVGLINTDLVKSLDFYAGGYSAKYGNRMSSVADIQYRRGSRERWQGQLDLNMAGFGGAFEGPIGNDGSLWVSGNRSFLDLIGGSVNAIGSPRFGDVQAKADFNLGSDHQFTILQVFGDSGTEWGREEPREEGRLSYLDMHNQVNTTGLNWHSFWSSELYSTTSVSWSFLSQNITYRYTETNDLELDYNTRHDYASFRHITHWNPADMHQFELGSDIIYTNGDYDYYYAPFVNKSNIERPEVRRDLQVDNWKAEFFGSYILSPASYFTLTLGGRFSYNNINENWSASPRIGTSLEVTDRLTLKASGGIYRQELPLVLRSQQEAFHSLDDPYVRQMIAGFDYLLGESTQLTVEVYEKQYRQMPIQPTDYSAGPPTYVFDDSGTFFDELEDDGESWARGIDVMLHRKMANGFYGTLSGSYFRSRYKDYKGDWQNRDFDVEYLVNIIAGYRPSDRWEISARWSYIGSRPFTPLDIATSEDQNTTIFDITKYNQTDMPAFHSLYLRGDRRFFLNSFTLTTFIEVWNAYNRANVEDYYWNQNTQRHSSFEPFSFLPVGGVLVEF